MGVFSFAIRAAEAGDGGRPAFRHAAKTDPEGAFVAVAPDGAVLGRAAGVVRDDTLLLAALDVVAGSRGCGIGSALLAEARRYGAARRAEALEAEIPLTPESLGFAVRRGFAPRALLLELEAGAGPAPPEDVTLDTLAGGAGLSGWIATLDRETRGFARTPDWTTWLRSKTARAFSLKRGGRPEAAAALFVHEGRAHLGPIAAKTPTAAAAALGPLAARARAEGAERLTVTVAADARLVLDVALRLGFTVAGSRALLATRPRGDFRRAAGGPAFF